MLTEQQINENVTCLSLGMLHTNTYIIHEGDNCVVIDPPFNKFLVEYLKDKNLAPTAILLTHGHFDHCGGVQQLLNEYPNLNVYCHRDDAAYCNRAQQNLWHVRCENCNPNCIFEQGKTVIGGFDFEIIFTPGHSFGSVTILWRDVMFSGDTLFAGAIGRTDFEGSHYISMVESLQKLKKLTPNYIVCPGHGEMSTLDHEKKYNSYLI